MASEPSDTTASIPENLADDVPTDVDWTALMARSQNTLIHTTALQYQANADMEQKLRMFGLGQPPAEQSSAPTG